MSSDLYQLDATEVAEVIRTKRTSSVDVVQAHLDRIEAVDASINAIVTVAVVSRARSHREP